MEKPDLLWNLSNCLAGVLSDSIQPKETNIYRKEEERVTLSCLYDTSSENVYLYWYRQYPNKEPEYLLRKGARSWSSSEDIPDRFQSTTSRTSTELIIKSVSLSDSALYYCALRVGAQWYKIPEKLYKNSHVAFWLKKERIKWKLNHNHILCKTTNSFTNKIL